MMDLHKVTEASIQDPGGTDKDLQDPILANQLVTYVFNRTEKPPFNPLAYVFSLTFDSSQSTLGPGSAALFPSSPEGAQNTILC
jgi:hypothetical protein